MTERSGSSSMANPLRRALVPQRSVPRTSRMKYQTTANKTACTRHMMPATIERV